MQVQLSNRIYTTRNYEGSNTWLLTNSGQRVQENFQLIFNFDFTTSPQQQVRFLTPFTLQLIGGDWGDLGFTIGASVALTGTMTDLSTGGTYNYAATPFTINDIQGDILTTDTSLYTPGAADITGGISPNISAGNDALLFDVSTEAPETIEIYHNQVPNANGFSPNSFIDGEVNRFKAEGIDSMIVTDVINFEQLGNKSGGAYTTFSIERRPDVGGKRDYEITIVYFQASKFQDADFEKPTYLEQNNSLKPVYRILAYPQENNPNSVLTYDYTAQNGNVGWYNENYNQGVNDFTIDSVVIEGADGTILSEIDHNQTCTVTATITAAADFRDVTEVEFYLIPPTSEWQNNEFNFGQNIRLSNYFQDITFGELALTSFIKNGQEVTTANQTIDVATANQIVISFDVVPNAAFTTYVNSLASSERQYRITAYVESVGGTDNENNGVCLTIQQGLLTAAPVPDQPYDKVDFQGFYNHAQDLETGTSEVNYNGCTEDDFVWKSLFSLTKNVLWEQLSLSIEVVRNSDGAFFQLENKVVSFINAITSPDGTININYSEQLNQYLDSTGRNVLTVKNTGVEVGADYEVKIVWSLVASWRYWIAQNNALSDFFDGAIPNNGRNNEWMRYLREAGYSIRLRARLLKSGVNYYWGGNINLQDYEANLLSPAINTTIQYFDEDGTEQTALLPNQDMIIRAEHTLLSGSWSVLDVWGWIVERGFENDPSKRITTSWNWTSQTSPLKPLTGETKAKLTFPSAAVARVECRVDTSQLGDITNTFVARIESPISPACISLWSWLFDYIVANSDGESDYVTTLINLLGKGANITDSNVCCPTCIMTTVAGPTDLEVFAFGGSVDVGNYIKDYSTLPCCRDTYAGALGCDLDFTTDLDTFAALVGDSSFLTDIPDQINAYAGNNVDDLIAEITALTTNNSIRALLMRTLVGQGIAFTCDPLTGDKFITGL